MQRLVVVMSVLCVVASQVAARMECPSEVCEASFNNSLGGPIDCCEFDFAAANDTVCRWGGTPVSFTAVGYCDEAKSNSTHLELVKNNSQGPPNEETCRCPKPLASCRLLAGDGTQLAEGFGLCMHCYQGAVNLGADTMVWGQGAGCQPWKSPVSACCGGP